MVRSMLDAEGSNDQVGKLASQLAARSPQGRMAYPTDIADVALFLMSDGASFVTGQVIPVNGGSD
jgi:3-oxoacyl-[acyl-carrier protein] reductase